MVSHYFNAIDRLSVVEAVAPEFGTRHTVDVDFDGPYIGVQVALKTVSKNALEISAFPFCRQFLLRRPAT